jgi:hypothetical protein
MASCDGQRSKEARALCAGAALGNKPRESVTTSGHVVVRDQQDSGGSSELLLAGWDCKGCGVATEVGDAGALGEANCSQSASAQKTGLTREWRKLG